MKFLICFILNISISFSQSVQTVYGEDSRLDIVNSNDPLFKELARSVALVISNKSYQKKNNIIDLNFESFKSKFKVCEQERFSRQTSFGYCTSFLVGKDLLLTAGHCFDLKNTCRSTSFLFDYKINKDGIVDKEVNKDKIYHCKKIISIENSGDLDHALIKLDRVVKDRVPLLLSDMKQVEKGEQVLVIGHPSGLPLKIADGAQVRTSKNQKYFKSNLDTFGGNSGSPVFNLKTAKVEGILVRGDIDFIFAPWKTCKVSKVCRPGKCIGEDSTSVSALSFFDNLVEEQKQYYKENENIYKKAKRIYSLRNKERDYYRSKKYYLKSYWID